MHVNEMTKIFDNAFFFLQLIDCSVNLDALAVQA